MLVVVGLLIGLLGQRLLDHWNTDRTNNLPHNTTHHHRT